MISREMVETALVDAVDPVLRAAGFDGRPTTWRRRNRAGDWAVVDLAITAHDDQATQCVVNLAVVPAPWLEFLGVWLGRAPNEVYESMCLYRGRLTPEGREVRSVEAIAEVADDVVRGLTEHGLPLLDRLQDRATFLESLRAGDLGMLERDHFPGLFAFAEAMLISEEGPSEHLEELLDVADELAAPDRKEALARYSSWIRERAEHHGER